MSHSQIRTLLEEASAGVPDPDLVDRAWQQASNTRRRRRAAALVGSAATALVTVLAITTVMDRNTQPTPADQSTQPTAKVAPPPESLTGDPIRPDIVQDPWPKDVRWLPNLENRLPGVLGGVLAAPADLSDDPVKYAIAAVERSGTRGSGVVVFGDDGRWRVVDTPLQPASDSAGYESSALRPTSLSPDGTRLALPQPHSLVVVDLTTGEVRRFDVPGFNQSVVWTPDGSQILVGTEERPRGVLVDASDGMLRSVPYSGLHTAYAPDGTALELRRVVDGDTAYELRRFPPEGEQTVELEVWDKGEDVPAAADDALLIMRSGTSVSPGNDLVDSDGPLVLDARTGAPLALLPIRNFGVFFESELLGWLDDETALLRIDDHLVAWNYVTAELRRFAEGQPGLTVALAPARLLD